MNVNILSGYVVEDNEHIKLREIPGNQDKVTSFTLAVSRDKPSLHPEETAYFLPIVAWGKVAEFCAESLDKGMYIELQGYTRTGRRGIKGIEKVIYKNGDEVDSLSIPIYEVNARWIKIISTKSSREPMAVSATEE